MCDEAVAKAIGHNRRCGCGAYIPYKNCTHKADKATWVAADPQCRICWRWMSNFWQHHMDCALQYIPEPLELDAIGDFIVWLNESGSGDTHAT